MVFLLKRAAVMFKKFKDANIWGEDDRQTLTKNKKFIQMIEILAERVLYLHTLYKMANKVILEPLLNCVSLDLIVGYQLVYDKRKAEMREMSMVQLLAYSRKKLNEL